MASTIRLVPHPHLDLGLFVTVLVRPLLEIATPEAVHVLARANATAPIAPAADVKTCVRDLLRHGGFKPAGRSKPASEYLAAAITDGRFPEINPLVDTCNVVSLHSGLPISVIDLDRVSGELVVQIAPAATSYAFNPSGQVIDAGGLVCVFDGLGPTATPVKDAQRTKTHGGTRRALSIVWGTRALAGHAASTTRWYRELVGAIAGATIEDVTTCS